MPYAGKRTVARALMPLPCSVSIVPWPKWSPKLILVVLLAYWIARNIDVFPLCLLAPHEI